MRHWVDMWPFQDICQSHVVTNIMHKDLGGKGTPFFLFFLCGLGLGLGLLVILFREVNFVAHVVTLSCFLTVMDDSQSFCPFAFVLRRYGDNFFFVFQFLIFLFQLIESTVLFRGKNSIFFIIYIYIYYKTQIQYFRFLF